MRHTLTALRRPSQSVSPGLVETQFLAKMAGRPDDQLKVFSRMKALEVEDVVRTVLHLLQTPPHVQVGQT